VFRFFTDSLIINKGFVLWLQAPSDSAGGNARAKVSNIVVQEDNADFMDL